MPQHVPDVGKRPLSEGEFFPPQLILVKITFFMRNFLLRFKRASCQLSKISGRGPGSQGVMEVTGGAGVAEGYGGRHKPG